MINMYLLNLILRYIYIYIYFDWIIKFKVNKYSLYLNYAKILL